MQQAADAVFGILNTQHDIRINIYQKHTESNRYKQQRFKILGDRQIEKNARHQNHQNISPCHVEKCGLMDQVVHGCHNIRHCVDLLCQ